jgi:mannose-6-phosphate isomerase-like protein (cupin superfamily)
MLIKTIQDIPSFIAGDKTIIKEVLHPKNDAANINYSLAHATVNIGEKSIPHKLKSSEVYIILNGKGKVHIDDSEAIIEKGQLVFIPQAALQWIENIGDTTLDFLCIVEPSWKAEDEIVL